MDAKIIAKLLKTLPTCEHNIELTRPENENVHLNYGWANSIADYIEQQDKRIKELEKYAELGRLAVEGADECHCKFERNVKTGECDNCCFESFCQLRAELLTEEENKNA
jgi:hypothetical protein